MSRILNFEFMVTTSGGMSLGSTMTARASSFWSSARCSLFGPDWTAGDIRMLWSLSWSKLVM